MTDRWRMWLVWGKAVLAVLIVVGVVWLFARLLQEPELQAADATRSPGQILGEAILAANPSALVLAGVCYSVGLTCWALFWVLLLVWAREPLPVLTALRACYLSHLGKYVPLGKGWALLVRVGLGVQAGLRPGTVAVTTAYETLTTMAAGALLAVVLLLVEFGDRALFWPAVGLLVLAGLPILPGVFNFLVSRIGARFRQGDQPWPRFGSRTLLTGLALTACGWAWLGASLAATLGAIDVALVADPLTVWLRCTAFVAISYVAGFVASTPGGLGVRELVLQQLLAPTLGARAVVVVVLLRLLWTVAELTVAGVVFWWPSNVRRA